MFLFLGFGFVGCSAVKLSYDFADWLIEYRLEEYVDLRGEQEDRLQTKLKEFMRWHRNEIMPNVVLMSADLKAAQESRNVVGTFAKLQPRLDMLYRESAQRLARIVGDVFYTLSAKQIEELEYSLKEKFEERFNEASAAPDKPYERFVERMDNWLGGLQDGQKELFRGNKAPLRRQSRMRFECRRVRQNELISLLKGNSEREKIQGKLIQWWTMSNCGEESDRARIAMRSTMLKSMSELEQTLTTQQQGRLGERLTDLYSSLKDIVD